MGRCQHFFFSVPGKAECVKRKTADSLSTVCRLLNVLEVIAPFKHFNKLREFVQMKLPPGFPVKLGTCCRSTVVELQENDDNLTHFPLLSRAPLQTSPSSLPSQQLSPFRNSATMSLKTRLSSSLRSTKKIPVASQTSDQLTQLTQNKLK